MKSRTGSAHPHLDHLFKIGVLQGRTRHQATRAEAEQELHRYYDEGLILQSMTKEAVVASKEPDKFSGRGILFAVVDDREKMREGKVSTVDVIADAIESALDAGQETSEEIARFLVTSAFQHEPDKRIRFNSVLKASDVVGAMITRKLYNSYNELAKMAEESEDPKEREALKNEATGFAEAMQVVISPFSSEDPKDPRLVNWDEVDRMTAAFEKEQRFVRKERKGNPQ